MIVMFFVPLYITRWFSSDFWSFVYYCCARNFLMSINLILIYLARYVNTVKLCFLHSEFVIQSWRVNWGAWKLLMNSFKNVFVPRHKALTKILWKLRWFHLSGLIIWGFRLALYSSSPKCDQRKGRGVPKFSW